MHAVGPRRLVALSAVQLAVLLAHVTVHAVSGQPGPSDPRAAALGGAAVGLADDVRGHANPASWAAVPASMLYLEASRPYGLAELNRAGVLLLVPFPSGAAAVGVSTYGYDLYRSTVVEAGLGLRVAPGTFRTVSFGFRPRWHHVGISGYGSAGALSLSVGVLLPVTPVLTLGASALNLVAAGTIAPDLARRLDLGAAVRTSQAFTITVAAGKDLRSPASISTGVELRPVPSFILRAGTGSSPARVTLGAGLRHAHLRIDVAGVRHETLGWTPSLALCVGWQPEEAP